jgi:hypothetical protein
MLIQQLKKGEVFELALNSPHKLVAELACQPSRASRNFPPIHLSAGITTWVINKSSRLRYS